MDIGTRVQCRWRDGQFYPVRVIERRPGSAAGNPEEYEYYVHYEQFNRRLDTWVTVADMNVKSAEQDDPKKRGAEEHDEEHAEFDPNALREHEEVTKVRNILKVELGRHEMDTWYFSPFPARVHDVQETLLLRVHFELLQAQRTVAAALA
jgi:histone acetyltransferase MYST1